MFRLRLSLKLSVLVPRVPIQSFFFSLVLTESTAFLRPPLQCGLLSTCQTLECEKLSCRLDERERELLRFPVERDVRRWTRACVLGPCVVWCGFFAPLSSLTAAETEPRRLCVAPAAVLAAADSPGNPMKGFAVFSARGVALGVTARDCPKR